MTYYSMDTQITRSGAYDGVDRPDMASDRAYHEEYTWQQSTSNWDVDLSFPTTDLPFGSAAPPEIDVARARMTFGSAEPQVLDRSGALIEVPSNRPQLTSDTAGVTYQEIRFPTGTPSQSLAMASADGLPSDIQALIRRRRAAALERLVVTPQTTLRVLAQLREAFRERRGQRGTLLFTQARGNTEVEITFDLVLGGITHFITRSGGRKVAETVHRYAPIDGVLALSEQTTTLFGRDGRVTNTLTTRHSNITIR
ncbi:MAG: hypothetical protein ACREON_00605 [Gemmatimonadaceae bacterium]